MWVIDELYKRKQRSWFPLLPSCGLPFCNGYFDYRPKSKVAAPFFVDPEAQKASPACLTCSQRQLSQMSTLVGAGALPANTGGDVMRQLSRVTSGGRSEQHRSSGSIEDNERGASSATSATAHQLKSAGASRAHGPLVELKQRHEPNASMVRPLGVSWNDLSVRGSNTGIVYNETVLSQ